MAHSEDLVPFAVKSYRYLRFSIVVLVLVLLASVVIERTKVACWQGSISAYYYTPVHAVFVGALVAVGVCLIAIKGNTDWEDMLLNLAGVMAPIVAFVPTSIATNDCASTAFLGGNSKANIDNNVLAFAIGGALALLLVVLLAKLTNKGTIREIDHRSRYGVLFGLAILVIGVVWYIGFRDGFLKRAHGGAAVLMFFIIFVVMVINARSADKAYRKLYTGTACAMAAAAVVAVVGKLIDSDWQHQILWLEVLELGAFAVYWAGQTFEHWDGGVPTGDERISRTSEATTRH